MISVDGQEPEYGMVAFIVVRGEPLLTRGRHDGVRVRSVVFDPTGGCRSWQRISWSPAAVGGHGQGVAPLPGGIGRVSPDDGKLCGDYVY